MNTPIAKLESSIDSLREDLKNVKQKEYDVEHAAAEILDQMKKIEQKADGTCSICFVSIHMDFQTCQTL